MTNWTEQDIREIYDTESPLVLAITGGGASAISTLLAVAGASRSVLEAVVPYHASALAAFLGRSPEQSCSGATARAMAMTAFQRAMSLIEDQSEQSITRCIGVACTAALTTDRSRKGRNRCFIAVQSMHETREITLELNKGERNREAEDSLCGDTIIGSIRTTLGLDPHVSCSLEPGERLESEAVTSRPGWFDLVSGQTKSTRAVSSLAGAIFPGTFSPLHKGHQEMVRIAKELLGTEVTMEISVFNVDKTPLDYIEMARRLQNIGEQSELVFTHAPTFLDKARLFPGKTFVVGIDTMDRIVSPRYYENSEKRRDEALAEIRDLGNRFLVFGRLQESAFRSLDDMELPDFIRGICTLVPESRFRVDISSTHLRAEDRGQPLS